MSINYSKIFVYTAYKYYFCKQLVFTNKYS
jgi:hypothetical protein